MHLVLPGDGPERAALRRLVDGLGVAGRVRFLGVVPRAEVPALLRSVDVLALTPRYELGMLAAIARLHQRDRPLRVVITGEGREEALRWQANRCRCGCSGSSPDVPALLRGTARFCLPSRSRA